jgi:N-acetylglucosamine kinase
VRICADVGGSFVDFAVVGDDWQIRHRYKKPTPTQDWPAFVALFVEARARFAALVAAQTPVAIAFAGLIDQETGTILSANLPAIHGRRLAQDLGAELGCAVAITNDADAFVLAEAELGAARGHRRVFGIVLGTGVGGGLIEDGRILSGAGGVGGEWGHGPIFHSFADAADAIPVLPCGCGRMGCLDTLGGARGMERLHHFLHGADATSREITARWEAGDAAAARTIRCYAALVAGPIAMILNTFPATIVPVGGGLASAVPLVVLIDERVRAGMLKAPSAPLLVPTVLEGNGGLLGAALAVRSSRQA